MASKRRLRRNACKGKVRFDSDLAAQDALHAMKRRTGTQSYLTSYKCKFCGGFHYGHPPKAVRQAIFSK